MRKLKLCPREQAGNLVNYSADRFLRIINRLCDGILHVFKNFMCLVINRLEFFRDTATDILCGIGDTLLHILKFLPRPVLQRIKFFNDTLLEILKFLLDVVYHVGSLLLQFVPMFDDIVYS